MCDVAHALMVERGLDDSWLTADVEPGVEPEIDRMSDEEILATRLRGG